MLYIVLCFKIFYIEKNLKNLLENFGKCPNILPKTIPKTLPKALPKRLLVPSHAA